MATAVQTDPYAKYGGSVADDSGQPSAQGDPYAKYGGQVAGGQSAAQPDSAYAKYNQAPAMSRPEADTYLQKLATGGQGTYQPPKQPKFGDTLYVDPQDKQFGGDLGDIHSLVPSQQVPQARAAIKYRADLMTRQHSPGGELYGRGEPEEGDSTGGQLIEGLGHLGEMSGDLGASVAGMPFKQGSTAKGIASGTGRFVGTMAGDPLNLALAAGTGGAGPVVRTLSSAGFAALMGKNAVDQAGQLGAVWDNPDIPYGKKVEMETGLLLNIAMAGAAGKHAVKVPMLEGSEPFLSFIPKEYRTAVAQNFNSAIKETGGIITRTAGTVGDVMAAVGNADRENVPTLGVTALKKAVPKIPTSSAEAAMPLVKAVADNSGLKQITADDLLNSQPDENGVVSPGLISEAKKEVIMQAGKAAGPGKTIADLSPKQLQPFNEQLNALDDLHDHIQSAQDKETEALKATANKELPQSAGQALMSGAKGAAKYGLAAGASAIIPGGGILTRAAIHAAGIGSAFRNVSDMVKYFAGGGKLSPTLDDNLDAAFGKTQAGSRESYGDTGETREAPVPYQGDLSVQHETNIYPPETPHGNATVLPDEPNPRFQLSSSSTSDPYARYGGRIASSSTAEPQAFTSVPRETAPEQTPRQLNLRQQQPQGSMTSDVVNVGPKNAEDYARAAFEERRAEAAAQKLGTAQPQPEPAQSELSGAAQQAKKNFEAQRQAATSGDIFPNDNAMEDWLNNQYERSPRVQKIKDLVKERIQQGDLPPGIRPSADELNRMDSQIHSMIYEANQQGVDTPAQLDRIDQWIQATNKQPKPFQPGQPLKTRPAPAQQALPQDQGYTGPERRQAMDYRAQVNQMSPADQAKAIFFSEKTGLPNYRAFQQSEQLLGKTHPVVGYADVDDFKSANTALGKEAVDTKILPMIGDLFRQAAQDEPGVHVFHRSGDEFLFRADDPAAVTRVTEKVNQQLQGAKFTAQRADGSIVEHTGTGLSHGTGNTEDAAELAAEDSKQSRKLQGLRTGARDTAAGQVQEANAQPTIFQGNRTGGETSEGNATQRSNVLVRPAASLKPGDSSLVPTSDLKTDPSRFQYKGGTNEQGVTNALKDQNSYDPNKGGVLLTWKDPADGQTYVVNGHHRFELAQRAGEPNVLVRAIDARDAEEAKVIGAETNISEGHGSIVDAARYFKAARITTPQDAMNRNLPMGQAKVKDGLDMAKLDSSILDRVESGKIPEGRAVAIGSVTGNPAQQDATLQAIDKAERRSGRDLNNGEVESIARQVKAADSHVEQGQDLFGMFNREQSLYGEQAAIDDFVLRQLSGDKRTFGAVSSTKRAETLGQVEGQKINATENQKLSDQAAQASEIYKKLVNSPGVLNDIRTQAAKSLAGKTSNPQSVKMQAYARIRFELLKQLGGDEPPASEARK